MVRQVKRGVSIFKVPKNCTVGASLLDIGCRLFHILPKSCMKFVHTICCLLLAVSLASLKADNLSIGLVLDCSASMWNKLDDGRYRIDAAKDVLVDFLSTTQEREGLNVGLRIYGSKVAFSKPGACEDTVLVVPIRGFERQKMIDAVRKARAIGATPLALSLEKAVTDFEIPGQRRLIVCTDGEESCGGNVEAALRALKQAGVEVDVRVIGIGLTQAAADRFSAMGVPVENVNTTRGLAEALSSATQSEAPAPAIEPIPLTVRIIRNGSPLAGHEVVALNSLTGNRIELTPAGEGVFTGSALPGSYQVTVAPGDRVFQNQSVPQQGTAEWILDLTEAPKVNIEVSAPVIPAGDIFVVKYSGALGQDSEWVGMLPADEEDERLVLWQETGGLQEGELKITAPALPGRYRMAFYSKIGGEDVLAGKSTEFEITLPKIALKVPAEVPAASEMLVEWEGPALQGDWIGWVPEGAEEGAYEVWDHPEAGASPMRLIAPAEPGNYEMRYANQASPNVLARAEFVVVEADVSVSAPAEAPAGSTVSVNWKGPTTEGVFLTIVSADSDPGAYLYYHYTGNVESPVALQTPRDPMAAEVRLVARGPVILARAPIRLTEASASVQAPASVATESTFTVQWQGPGGQGDFITIVPAGSADDAYESYSYMEGTSGGVELQSPSTAGSYEVRYVRKDNVVIARQTVRVE